MGVAQDDFDIHSLLPNNLSKGIQVLMRPRATGQSNLSGRDTNWADILKTQPDNFLRRLNHGDKSRVRSFVTIMHLSSSADGNHRDTALQFVVSGDESLFEDRRELPGFVLWKFGDCHAGFEDPGHGIGQFVDKSPDQFPLIDFNVIPARLGNVK